MLQRPWNTTTFTVYSNIKCSVSCVAQYGCEITVLQPSPYGTSHRNYLQRSSTHSSLTCNCEITQQMFRGSWGHETSEKNAVWTSLSKSSQRRGRLAGWTNDSKRSESGLIIAQRKKLLLPTTGMGIWNRLQMDEFLLNSVLPICSP